MTVLGNTGNLVRANYTFIGWNSAADGSGTTHQPGTTFTMGSSDIVLYALWTQNTTYTVAYNGNGDTGGTIPVDNNRYEAGQTVTVLGNTGSLVKTGYVFSGWNTASNGSGTVYQPGATFAIASGNVTLYAQWATALKVSYSGNGNSSGTAPTDSNFYASGATVTAMGNTGSLARTGYTFVGWNTAADGSGSEYLPGATFTIGAGSVTLYADWVRYYLYTADYYANDVSLFAVGPGGVLNLRNTLNLAAFPEALASTPNGHYLYVADANSTTYNVSAFAVNPDGSLSAIQTVVLSAQPMNEAVSPNGLYLYVTSLNSNYLFVYDIGSDGTLTPNGTYTISSNGNSATPGETIAFTPNTGYVYVGNVGGVGATALPAFSINSAGTLSSITSVTTPSYPQTAVAVSPDGSYLYVLNGDNAGNGVLAYKIGTNGTPSSIGSYSTGSYPAAIAINPTGSYLFVANLSSNNVYEYSINTDGSLSSNGTIAAGPQSQALAVSPDGSYLYEGDGDGLSIYTVNANGTLTAAGSEAINLGVWGISLVQPQ